ncbi:MAG: hypothetical protein GXZ09_07665 [Syntrophomonadaceae bacterium]|jgi:hypothetical protein|nr:hypothetical protein [Syntrophomonadaceae bacterium]
MGMSKEDKFNFMFDTVLEIARKTKAIPYSDYLQAKFDIDEEDIDLMDKISRPFIEEFKQGKRTDYSTIQQSLTKAGMPLNKVDALICLFYARGEKDEFWEMMKNKPHYIENRFKQIKDALRPLY